MSDPTWTVEILRSQQLNKRDSAYWSKHYKELVNDFVSRSGIDDKATAQAEAELKANCVFQFVCDSRNRTNTPNSKDA